MYNEYFINSRAEQKKDTFENKTLTCLKNTINQYSICLQDLLVWKVLIKCSFTEHLRIGSAERVMTSMLF